MKKALAITVGLLLVAGVALASNTGFKLNYPLEVGVNTTNGNWMGFPYFWFPNGNVGALPQNSVDACVDFNGSVGNTDNVLSIARFNVSTDSPITKFCNNPISSFDLNPGEGYIVVPNGAGKVLAVVGSHDDNFASNKGSTTPMSYTLQHTGTTTNNNIVSIPYHSIADNDLEVCIELNGAPNNNSIVTSIARFSTATDSPITKFCSNPISSFALKPGEGYSLVPTGGPQDIQFEVY